LYDLVKFEKGSRYEYMMSERSCKLLRAFDLRVMSRLALWHSARASLRFKLFETAINNNTMNSFSMYK